MREKACCNSWEAIIPRIKEIISIEVANVKPEYLATPFYDMLHQINNSCPVCGEWLNEEVVPPRKKNKIVNLPESPTSPPTGRLCPKCKGAKYVGEAEGGIPITCSLCWGIGRLNSGNAGSSRTVNPIRKPNPDLASKMSKLRSKKAKKMKEKKD